MIQFGKYSEAKEYFQDVKQSQTDPAIIALCDAAIVTALHLEHATEEALNLYVSLSVLCVCIQTTCNLFANGRKTSGARRWWAET